MTIGLSGQQLKGFIEKVERLEVEKQDVADTIKEIFNEAKSNGFDVPTMKAVIKLRKKREDDIENEKALLDLYLNSIMEVSVQRRERADVDG